MLDLHYLTEHFDEVRQRTALRHVEIDFEELAVLLETRRNLIFQAEAARFEQRQDQERIKAIDKSSPEFLELRNQLRELSTRAKLLDDQRKEVVDTLQQRLLYIPNLVHQSVPQGRDSSDNAVIRVWGAPRQFDFPPRDHVDVGELLGLLDMDRAGKVTGARFAFLKGALARLSHVLVDFMLELHTKQHGYLEILPPFLVNEASMMGTGQLPKFREDSFQVDSYFLVPTAEVPVTNYHRDEILDEERLPIKYVAYSPCFRKEAGSYGIDTRGLIRQHQFEKVELVKFSHPDTSYQELESLVADAERVLQLLGLPYRVVSLCSGDLGFSAAKCYDLEVWIPSQNCYREISSCSNFEAFQARRANIRYRSPDGKPQHLHTLNGSGLAIGRTIVAILENYQNADGSLTIPTALVDRMKTDKLVGPQGA
ncbi:MAG: serine--tRNA ligase [Bradymonadales bacterium]|nr:serine--tRNA ligase [Bradymonadales bacterium]